MAKDHPLFKKLESDINENKIISDLQKKYDINDLLSFNEFNITEKLQNNAYLVEQFRLLCISEKNKLQKIENMINEETGKKYDHFKFVDNRDLSKVEIERYYLPKDEKLIRLKKLYQLQEIRVGFFDACCEAFKAQGWNIRNFLQNLSIGG